jgi:hypothetical protein
MINEDGQLCVYLSPAPAWMAPFFCIFSWCFLFTSYNVMQEDMDRKDLMLKVGKRKRVQMAEKLM